MKEKIILSIVAAFLGLMVAGGAFYIYQMTRIIDDGPAEKQSATNKSLPTPTPQNANYLIVESPKDEEVFDKKIITVSGRANPGATIIISTESSDQVVEPSDSGNFTLTHTIGDGVSLLNITAFFADGRNESVQKVVTFSTEDF